MDSTIIPRQATLNYQNRISEQHGNYRIPELVHLNLQPTPIMLSALEPAEGGVATDVNTVLWSINLYAIGQNEHRYKSVFHTQ